MQSIGPFKAAGLTIALCSLLCGSLFAQSTPTATAAIVSAGYSFLPGVLSAAPGQVLSLLVYGLEYRLQNRVVATSTPLPATLAGFSVTLQQGTFESTVNTFAVPLLGVQQSPCLNSLAPGLCPALTVLSVQIPFEVVPDCPICLRPFDPPASLTVSENGVPKSSVPLRLPPHNIHVVDACDTTALLSLPPNEGALCGKVVVHEDGSRVTASHPAKVGEQLVMYAFGLGRTEPLVKTGERTLPPAPFFPEGVFRLHFDFTPNAPPSFPFSRIFGLSSPTPVYAGLVAGFVGLYQVNFVVPPPPSAAPFVACDFFDIQSNLTVMLAGVLSFDGAGICVQAQ